MVDETCKFAHDVLREFFLESGEFGHGQHRMRLADCLRRLRPADYPARALNALGAGLDAAARALTVQAALAEIRAGRDWRAMPDPLVKLASSGDTAIAVDALASSTGCLTGIGSTSASPRSSAHRTVWARSCARRRTT